MTSVFWRDGDTVRVELDDLERQILVDLARQVAALVGPEDAVPSDPLAAMVGIGPQTQLPEDPALARLLPDAFTDDPAAAAEFRRFTEVELRTRKAGDAETVIADVTGQQPIALDDDRARRWLGFLNDVRLVLGSRLDVTEDPVDLDDDDPLLPAYGLYGWLGLLQETLVESLVPRHP